MPGSWVVADTVGELDGGLIVAQEQGRKLQLRAKNFAQQFSKPNDILRARGSRHEFRLHGGKGHASLFLAAPHHRSPRKKGDGTRNGNTIGLILAQSASV